eukprot:Opistho-2@60338
MQPNSSHTQRTQIHNAACSVSHHSFAALRYFANSERPTVCTCTSSGPSASRSTRAHVHSCARGVSPLRPTPPCACMARSITRDAMAGAATLIIAISALAALLPTVSISSAARRVRRRACSMSRRDAAMSAMMVPCSASGLPNAVRLSTRWHMSSRARSAWPISRMQWWIRPGPRRPCAISNPRPRPRRTFSAGTRTFSNVISAWPWGASSNPMTVIGRLTVTPGASMGTRTIECCRCLGACGSERPRTIASLHRGSIAPEIQCLWPLMTISSPTRSIRVEMFVASEDATAGSVIAKHDRVVPSNSGMSHFAFCCSVP